MPASVTLAQRKNHHLAGFVARAMFNSIIKVTVKASGTQSKVPTFVKLPADPNNVISIKKK